MICNSDKKKIILGEERKNIEKEGENNGSEYSVFRY